MTSPVVLIVLDGWGEGGTVDSSAIAAAKTPVIDSLREAYPDTLIKTSGRAVGLPDGQMGNSEVGHLNIGTGRVVPQELVRITDAFEDGSILENAEVAEVCRSVRERGKQLHLMGLCSEGGVHSHVDHLLGLLEVAKAQSVTRVFVHAFTDGRDTDPQSGLSTLQKLRAEMERIGTGTLATIIGRYYAMDRDRRWDRTQSAYEVLTSNDVALDERSVTEIVRDYYADEKTDEFIPPTRVARGAVEPGDGVIFFNFRPDRARQLCAAFVDREFDGFERQQIAGLEFVTFTQYDSRLPVGVAFKPQNLTNILGEVISRHGLLQFRAAETEKYPHVTYFFNGGVEKPFPGEERELIPSPQVATYDRAPEMSAAAVTEAVARALSKGIYSLIVVNYANPDMVGHTGNLEAAIAAVECVDTNIGALVDAIGRAGGTAIITADHGNAECMRDTNGKPWTAHTTNPVPLVLIEGEGRKASSSGAAILREDGCLADIAPTILEILDLPQPTEMTGRSLLLALPTEAKHQNVAAIGI
ncbi:MAG: 2,3-bisphosphoglycerate-independent phosphoglycerate mutase [Cyanobacteria bacterium J06641_5]